MSKISVDYKITEAVDHSTQVVRSQVVLLADLSRLWGKSMDFDDGTLCSHLTDTTQLSFQAPPVSIEGDVEQRVWAPVRRLPRRRHHGGEDVHVRLVADQRRVSGRLGRPPHERHGRAGRRHRARRRPLVPDRHRVLRVLYIAFGHKIYSTLFVMGG